MTQTILMIEDDPNITRINRSKLAKCGYRVLEAETLAQGRELLERERPDLLILDILLPDGSGLDFCGEVREKTHVPILFLTALDEEHDIVNGFDRGGDDYLTKPYAPNVLAARVKALLRRSQYAGLYIRGGLTLDVEKHQAMVNGEDIGLTKKEAALLLLFLRNEGRAIQVEALYREVWNQPMGNDANAVRIAVSRLRDKIKPAGFQISVLRGSGYRFEETGESSET